MKNQIPVQARSGSGSSIQMDGYDDNVIYVTHDPGPTKLPDHTSKLCPHCRIHNRIREYSRTVPLQWKDVNQTLPIHEPRVSSAKTWWNRWIIRWLIAPPDIPKNRGLIPMDSFPWFECWCIATCPKCGPERVRELDYARQFGRLRLVIFAIDRKLILLRSKVVGH